MESIVYKRSARAEFRGFEHAANLYRAGYASGSPYAGPHETLELAQFAQALRARVPSEVLELAIDLTRSYDDRKVAVQRVRRAVAALRAEGY
jgi:aminoglycoside phosphotransferase family enzyme